MHASRQLICYKWRTILRATNDLLLERFPGDTESHRGKGLGNPLLKVARLKGTLQDILCRDFSGVPVSPEEPSSRERATLHRGKGKDGLSGTRTWTWSTMRCSSTWKLKVLALFVATQKSSLLHT